MIPLEIYLITGIAAAGCALAVFLYLRRLRRGEGCCGTRGKAPPKIKAADRNKANYPYIAHVTIDGMTCASCARRVENALNSLEGTCATVDLGKRCARVYCKAPHDEAQIQRTIRDCGYTVLSLDGRAK